MRDIMLSCFRENAINVSHPWCSSYSNINACTSPSSTASVIPSVQNSVTFLYRITLSTTQKQLLAKVTWCRRRNHSAQGLSINLGTYPDDDPSSSSSPSSFDFNPTDNNAAAAGLVFRKKKGSRTIELDNLKIEVFWDLSAAKYEAGPEPVDGFYVLVMVGSEIALLLGYTGEESKTWKISNPAAVVAKVSLVSRQERYCSGNPLYATKARFCEKGVQHDILIRCGGEEEGLKYPVLSVCIDKKMVIRVKRLHWNFRGNQTIFIDGLLVDLMWDVHDWFFNPAASASTSGSGGAVFMFRTRSRIDSRLWYLEEKSSLAHKEQPDHDDSVARRLDHFSLLICACKSPSN